MSCLGYVVEWNHSLVTSSTIKLVICLVCEALGNTLSFHGLSRLQRVPWCLISIVSISSKLLLLPVVSCRRFHSSFLLVTSSLIEMLLVSISHLVLGIVLLLLHVLRCLFLFGIFLPSLVGRELINLLSCLWVPQMLVDVLYPISILSCPSVYLMALLYDWSSG